MPSTHHHSFIISLTSCIHSSFNIQPRCPLSQCFYVSILSPKFFWCTQEKEREKWSWWLSLGSPFFFFFFKLLAEGWYLRSSLKPRTNQVLTWGITVLFALLTEARLPEGEQALLGGKGTRTSFSKGKPVEGCTRDLAPEGARGCGRTGGTEGLLREGAGARPSLAFAEAGCWQLKGKRYRRFEQLINEPRTPGSMLYLRQSCRRKKEPGWFYLPP